MELKVNYYNKGAITVTDVSRFSLMVFSRTHLWNDGALLQSLFIV